MRPRGARVNLPTGKYKCIIADPPWPLKPTGAMKGKHTGPRVLPYQTMAVDEIAAMPVESLAEDAAHLWLWTTNRFLPDAFNVMRAWGFTNLATVTWVKPSGYGPYFASTTQHVLFGYYKHCRFPLGRYKPTHFMAAPKRHSEKPDVFYDLVRQISSAPRVELFARRAIDGFDRWGNEAP